MIPLPIDAELPRITKLLGSHRNLVLVAPPGAGKTTRLPPRLVDAPWQSGKVLMLQPRRVAARAAAARIAEEQGWQLGHEVGYQVRFERRIGPRTRLEVVTEGILTRRLQSDPLLEGVGTVLLDEFHERSIHSDLGLALLREVQRSVREDLRLVVMSATLEAEGVSAYLDSCPIVRLVVRQHPLELVYLRQPLERPIDEGSATTVKRALREDSARGNVLVFLPGAAEIRKTAQRLQDLGHTEVLMLHGALPAAQQDRALACTTVNKQRRVILSTNVAETSVTVAGVTAVVDSGLVRLPRHDPRHGLDRLDTVRISQASADQRAGRAARLGPGRAYRLWTQSEHASLPQQTPPEIRRIDLAPVVLELRAWGVDPDPFEWFEAPEAGALLRAHRLLQQLGALDQRNNVTGTGRAMLGLPLPPRLAALLLRAIERGLASSGALLAALLAERDIVRPQALHTYGAQAPSGTCDVLLRLELFEQAAAHNFRPAPGLDPTINLQAARHVQRTARDLLARLGLTETPDKAAGDARAVVSDETLRRMILTAYPDRVALRRKPGSDRGVMVGGRGVVLAPASVVRDAPLFVAIATDGGGRESRVQLASAVDLAWLPTRYESSTHFDPQTERVVTEQRLMYLDLCLEARPTTPDPDHAATLLSEAARRSPRAALQPDSDTEAWLTRARWLATTLPELGLPSFDQAYLADILPLLCIGRASFAELRREQLQSWIAGQLTFAQRTAIESQAPQRLMVPSGRELKLTYRDEGPPILAVRLQEMFGQGETPTVANGRVKVLLHLLAPNGRPAQVTQDLRSFWNRTYPEVRKELRQRYPKHAWPEDPWNASPSHRARRPQK